MKKTPQLIAGTLLLLAIIAPSILCKRVSAQEVVITGKKIEYILAYPGILPDNPLYSVKKIRDNVVYFLSRDYIKKANLKLDQSDKKAHMAIELSKKGKWRLAIETIIDGEQDFLKIPKLLTTSKKQGNGPTGNFILTLKLANEKHREVVESLLKDAPRGESAQFDQALNLNKAIYTQLQKL